VNITRAQQHQLDPILNDGVSSVADLVMAGYTLGRAHGSGDSPGAEPEGGPVVVVKGGVVGQRLGQVVIVIPPDSAELPAALRVALHEALAGVLGGYNWAEADDKTTVITADPGLLHRILEARRGL
jgi:hypothetical protein